MLTPLEERLERDEANAQIQKFRGEVEAEIRRRLVADRGAEELARSIRKPLPDHLPREIVVLEPKFTCRCNDPSCRTKIREEVTEVLEKIPSQLKVIRYIRPIYACRACEMVSQAPAPDLPILKGRPGPNLITHIAIAKYYDGLPLYRQSKIFEREGVEIERMVMADWMGHLAWWIAPLVEMIGAYVMSAVAIHADDTPIKVLSPGRGRTATGRLWIYAVDERPWAGERAPAAFYRYSPDRKGERPQEHLAGFSGFLHADAYAGYALPGITHVQCMAQYGARAPVLLRRLRRDQVPGCQGSVGADRRALCHRGRHQRQVRRRQARRAAGPCRTSADRPPGLARG